MVHNETMGRFALNEPLDHETRSTISDELHPPFLGGPSIASRAQLNRRMVELIGERGGECLVRRTLPLPIGPLYRGMSLNQLSLYAGGSPYKERDTAASASTASHLTDVLFVPTSGHPQLKHRSGGYRVGGSGRVCRNARMECDGSVTGYNCY